MSVFEECGAFKFYGTKKKKKKCIKNLHWGINSLKMNNKELWFLFSAHYLSGNALFILKTIEQTESLYEKFTKGYNSINYIKQKVTFPTN